jgi:hypothetical protein
MPPTYATARLFLGISNVGFWVILASVGLFYRLPAQVLGQVPPDLFSQGLALLLFLAGYVLLQAPFDYLGGYWLPRAYCGMPYALSTLFARWLQAVVIQCFCLALFGAVIAAALHYGGMFLAWLLFAALSVFLLHQQAFFGAMLGSLKFSHATNGVTIGQSLDEPFTGGIAGLGANTVIVVPKDKKLLIERRKFLLQSGQRERGWRTALWFNGLGFALALYLTTATATGSSLGRVIECSLIFTIWSFLGLLTLPSLTRPAVYSADASLREGGTTRDAFENFLAQDLAQSGEVRRSAWVETIFHPLPSAENRMLAWDKEHPSTEYGAWMAARYALFLSWPALSLLPRAVHCNVGQPDLWVFPPAD